ncbi:MAG TPA: hypothetical protein VK783_10990 [Bacteroidia bacterium]|jgi:hypothetical protein|nr:hypothetical protein [Bacteroidia bacterium]
MADNKKHITSETITEWLASTGFIFPRNETELNRFEKLYGKPEDSPITESINADRIISNIFPENTIKKININKGTTPKEFRMVARNGGNLPKHIIDKIMKNQQKAKDNNDGTEEKGN